MLPTLDYLDRQDNGNRVSSLFEDISPLPWEDGEYLLNYKNISISSIC